MIDFVKKKARLTASEPFSKLGVHYLKQNIAIKLQLSTEAERIRVPIFMEEWRVRKSAHMGETFVDSRRSAHQGLDAF